MSEQKHIISIIILKGLFRVKQHLKLQKITWRGYYLNVTLRDEGVKEGGEKEDEDANEEEDVDESEDEDEDVDESEEKLDKMFFLTNFRGG